MCDKLLAKQPILLFTCPEIKHTEKNWTYAFAFRGNDSPFCGGCNSYDDHLTTLPLISTRFGLVSQRFAELDDEQAREEFNLRNDVQDRGRLRIAQRDIRSSPLSKAADQTNSDYRPFDKRFIYYTGRTNRFHCAAAQTGYMADLHSANENLASFSLDKS